MKLWRDIYDKGCSEDTLSVENAAGLLRAFMMLMSFAALQRESAVISASQIGLVTEPFEEAWTEKISNSVEHN